MKGAEILLGDGDMLFHPQGIRTPLRVQGTFVSDEEIENMIDFCRKQAIDSMCSDGTEDEVKKVQHLIPYNSATMNENGIDELFEQAGKFVIEHNKASVGMLQRVFKIGFNRAYRIMEQLTKAGVVGPEEGTKPREISMSMEQFEQYIKEI